MERTQVPADMHLELFASRAGHHEADRLRLGRARAALGRRDARLSARRTSRAARAMTTSRSARTPTATARRTSSPIFADHLNLPTSLTFANGGVIVAQPPRFLFLKSTKGDDHADVREVLMDGWGIRDTHAQANNLHYGYDNWIYGCVGYSGFKGMVGGKTHEVCAWARIASGRTARALEFLHQFSNNSWGAKRRTRRATISAAPRITRRSSSAASRRTVVPRGHARDDREEDQRRRQGATPITPNFRQVDVFGGYTAAAGSAFIYSANLPPRLQGQRHGLRADDEGHLAHGRAAGRRRLCGEGRLQSRGEHRRMDVAGLRGSRAGRRGLVCRLAEFHHPAQPDAERGARRFRGARRAPAARTRIRCAITSAAASTAWCGTRRRSRAKTVAATARDRGGAGERARQRHASSGASPRSACSSRARRPTPRDALKKLVAANDGAAAAIHALWALARSRPAR